MGVAGLARRLEPYCTRIAAADLSGYKAIVDGPSLAYHAQKLAITDNLKNRQAHVPSYADINRQALRWLRALEDINIKVVAILFDGALPAAKIDERLARLNHSNSRVRLFRTQYPSASCPIPSSLGTVSYPLLAPALREALSDSEFASATRLVPGEADDWCMPYTYDATHSVIFSSDSDLLLYEYDAECRIMLFDNVQLWPEPKFKGYSPVKIRQSLGLSSLLPLAYCLTLDKHMTFNALVESANGVNVESSDYLDFSWRYEGPEEWEADPRSQLSVVPQHLDNRLSEFISQITGEITTPVVYLPLLVEDPHAASAWSMGHDIRLLAYSLFTEMDAPPRSFLRPHKKKHRHTVEEYRRKAEAVSVHQVKLYNPSEMPIAAAEMANNISNWIQWMTARQAPQDLVWPLVAANLILLELPKAPTISSFIRVLTGRFDNSWDFVHLTARLHAALYSLRMLKQCVDMWIYQYQNSSAEPRQHMDTLNRHLVDMPTISDLFLIPGQARKTHVDEKLLKELLEDIYASAKIEVPSENISNRKLKKKQNAEKKERRTIEMKAEAGRSFNVFDLLNRET
ncbi:hypothetical protein CC80DRAFT_590938 [Byssothecium circinans]|uniref:Asteroid domain-containing protein n=1 Tax=Byssothecium circinans TaxID=147558 RepID=A0A6A5U4F3_9PLEO|nr:hypothetical protein CC80DRAFT_590938 [Byssothecium circinans]